MNIDFRPYLYRSFDHAADIVTGIQPAQLTNRTPCQEFDVDTLIAHVVGNGHRLVALGRGENPYGMDYPRVDLNVAPSELRRTRMEAEEVWTDDAKLEGVASRLAGVTFTGDVVVAMYFFELVAHAWDLAVSTGQVERLDQELARPALDAAKATLPPEGRDMVAPGIPFGVEITVSADAPAWEQLAAYLGRDPHPALQ